MATNIKLKRSASASAAPTTSDLALGELALNTYDGKLYMKKSVSGSESIVNLSGSTAASSSAFSHTTYKFVASGSTTTFTGSDADSQTLAYTAGQIQVFLNGILLDVSDYTASNGTSVVLGSATGSGSILLVTSFEGTNPFDYFKYTATANQTTFTGNDANSESLIYTVGNTQVYLNGVLLDATDYTATSGTTVVLASGATSGDILTIWEFNETGLSDVSNDTSPQLAGNLDVVTYDIVSTSNRNIDIVPHGTGDVTLQTDTVTLGSSGENVTVSTSGTGDLTLNTNSGSNSGSIVIADAANSDITLTPNGSGNIILDGLTWPNADGSANQTIITDGSGALSFTSFGEVIADTVGAMVSSNTETNITVTYEDGDNTLDFVVGTLNQDTTGTADLITASANNSTDETVYPTFVDGATGSQGIETDTGLTYNPSTGMLTATGLTGTLTGNVTGNVTGNTSGTAATVTTAAQTNITSLGTLTALTVDNLGINGNTITANSGALNLTPAGGSAIVLDGTISVDAGVVTGATSITSTAFVGALTGNVTGNTSGTAATVTTAAQTNITSLGSLTGLDVNGAVTINDNLSLDGSNKELRFYEGANYVGFEAPALSADQIWVLPTADGSANQTLKTDGSGTLSWATAASAVSNLTDVTISSLANGHWLRYNGSNWVNEATAVYPTLATMTGDASDTTLALGATPLHENATHVYLDGVYQNKDTYSVSGSTLTFSEAPPANVKVEAMTNALTNILQGNDVAVDTMTGDNSDTTLTLSVTPSNENHVNVYFNGVYQEKSGWSLSGTTVTFSTAPPTGVTVEAVSNQMLAIGTATGMASSVLTGLSEVTAVDADHVLIYDASGSALKKSLVSDFAKNTSEEIADIVGAMVSSNTESGITVAYEDGDNTLDFTVGTLNQDTTGTADNVTASANNSTDETVYPTFVDGATGSQGIETDTGLTYNPSSGLMTLTELSATTLDIGGTNITSTAAELNYVDGVTSAIQTQMDTKASTAKAWAMQFVFG